MILFQYVSVSDGDDAGSTEAGFKTDPLPVFLSDRVQKLLQDMTGFDMFKIAGPKPAPLSTPKYKLLTDEELKQVLICILKNVFLINIITITTLSLSFFVFLIIFLSLSFSHKSSLCLTQLNVFLMWFSMYTATWNNPYLFLA